jgi:hypothetical protein
MTNAEPISIGDSFLYRTSKGVLFEKNGGWVTAQITRLKAEAYRFLFRSGVSRPRSPIFLDRCPGFSNILQPSVYQP